MLFRNLIFHILVFLLYFMNIHANLTKDKILASLTRWVSITDRLVTWHSLTTDTNSIGHQSDFSNNNATQIENLTNTMNNRVRTLTCTYAYYAQRHLEEIHTIVDNDLLFEQIIFTVSVIKSSYLNIALKMLRTISNLGYDPPEWMFKIIPFLQADWTENDLKGLADLLITLIKFHSENKCNVPKLNPTEKRKINIMLSFDSEIEEVLTINLIKELYNFQTMTVGNWLQKYQVPETIKQTYYPDKLLPQLIPEKYSSSFRICGTYLSSQLKQIALNVQNNLLDSYYILETNNSIVPFKNYEYYHPPRFIKPLNENEIKTFGQLETIGGNNESTQISTFKSLVNSLVFDTLWYPQGMDKMVESKKQLTHPKNSTKLDRSLFSNLKNTKNCIMDNLDMLYLYYALVHFDQALLLLQYIKLIPNKKKNFEYIQYLINLYDDISLMTIATFTNNQYYPPEWMVRLVVYFMEESSDIKNTQDIDGKIELSISEIKIIKTMLEEVNSKINPKKLKPLNFDIKGIQFDDNNTTDKLYVNLLREYKLFKIKDFLLMPYVDVLYSNLAKVAYLLDFNSKHLSYTNYEKFRPSKWLFQMSHLDENQLKMFTLDFPNRITLINPAAESDILWWSNAIETFLNRIKKKHPISNNNMEMIETSIFVHRHLMNLLQIFLTQGILTVLSQCYTINNWYNINIAKVDNSMQFAEVYNRSCGLSNSLGNYVKNLLNKADLNTDTFFVKLLEEINIFESLHYNYRLHIYSDIKVIANDEGYTNTLILGMKKLTELSIFMRYAFKPIIPHKVDNLINTVTRASEKCHIVDRNKAIIDAFNRFNDNFQKAYTMKNFQTHNLMTKSIGYYKPRKISVGYKNEDILW